MIPLAESSSSAIVEGLFRDKYREILAVLTREFGPAHLDTVEDAIQEAMLKALEVWSFGEVPDNPGGWLFVTARRRLIDKLRAAKRLVSEPDGSSLEFEDDPLTASPLEDDVLKLVFICCHPELSWKSQLSLMLKNLCSMGNSEIASVLLSTPEAVKRNLTRAKTRVRDLGLEFELPDDTKVNDRLDAVLRCLYMMFNEGYLSHGGTHLTQQSLCDQAVQLSRLLSRTNGVSDPGKVCALTALLCLQASRLRARTNSAGVLARLDEQDRSLWDRALISEGMRYLELSMQSKHRSSYHLQAGIAACHAIAPTYASTDWGAILRYYDELLAIVASPIIALNRTVAVAMTEGYGAALKAVVELESGGELAGYYLLHALKADYQRKLGHTSLAMDSYEEALRLSNNQASSQFLQSRITECGFDH